jgi:hypothetical protein
VDNGSYRRRLRTLTISLGSVHFLHLQSCPPSRAGPGHERVGAGPGWVAASWQNVERWGCVDLLTSFTCTGTATGTTSMRATMGPRQGPQMQRRGNPGGNLDICFTRAFFGRRKSSSWRSRALAPTSAGLAAPPWPLLGSCLASSLPSHCRGSEVQKRFVDIPPYWMDNDPTVYNVSHGHESTGVECGHHPPGDVRSMVCTRSRDK